MSPFELLVLGLGLPALIAAGGLGLFGALAAWKGWEWLRQIGAAIGLGCGMYIGQVAIQGWHGFPPPETTQWLGPLAVLGMIWGIVEAVVRRPWVVRSVGRLVLSAAVVWIMLRPLLEAETDPLSRTIAAVLVLAVWAWWEAADALAAVWPGWAMELALGVAIAAAGATLIFSFSLIHGRLAGVLGAALGGVFLVTLLQRKGTLARGGTAVVAVVYAALLLDGHFYSQLPACSAGLLALGPLGMAVGRIRWLRNGPRWRRVLVMSLAVLLPLALAVGIALKRWLATEDEYSEEMGQIRSVPAQVASVETSHGGAGYCL